MSKRDDYQTRTEEQLALWGARFESAKAKAGKEAPPEIKKQLEQWDATRNSALSKLAQLKATQGDEWDVVKPEMEKAWRSIELVLNDNAPAPAPGRPVN